MIQVEEAERLQKDLSSKILKQDSFPDGIKFIGGTDVEYDKETDLITGAIVVLDYKNKQLLEVATHTMEATFPYIPGLFSFRELPPLIQAYNKLKQKPDIVICDGQGIAHPRGFGMASHLGVELNIATIGCGKTRLYGKYEEPGEERGSFSTLHDEATNEEIGRVLRTQNMVRPVFVSVGHKISISSACSIVLEMSNHYRLPETTRLADQYAREALLKAKASMNQ